MKTFSENVLEKIQEENIEPKSRWAFVLKDGFMWFIGAFSLILGSLALAVIFSVFFNLDWGLGQQLGTPSFKMFFLVMPYVWVFLLGGFILITHYQLRHTKGGYRYSLPILLASVIGGSVLFGIGLYQLGIGQAVDEHFVERSGFYREVVKNRLDFVHNPKEGRLAGHVIESGNDSLQLKDLTGGVWEVDISEAQLPVDRPVPTGARVRVMGVAETDTFFLADELQPLKPRDKLRDHFPLEGEMKELRNTLRTR